MAGLPPITPARFTTRWLMSYFLLMSTYNPSGYSFYHWITSRDRDFLSIKVLSGMLLLTVYLALWPILYTTLGPFGFLMLAAIVAAGGLVAWDYGLMDHVRPSFYPYAFFAGVALIITCGLVWSHFQLQWFYLKQYRKVTPKRYGAPARPATPIAPAPAATPAAPPPLI